MSKPACLGNPLAAPPREVTMSLKALSFISNTLFQTTLLISICSLLPQ